MALKLAYNHKFSGMEISFPDAVYRIDQIYYGKNPNRTINVSINVGVYPNIDKMQNEPLHSENIMFQTYDQEGEPVVKQAYNYLKTLEKYSNAVDV